MAITGLIERTVDIDRGVQLTLLNQLFATSDVDAHTIRVHVKASSAPVMLDGAGVIGYFIRADGETVLVTGSASGNTATVTLPESCYAVTGHFSLIVKAIAQGERKAIFWGDGFVTRASTDAIVDPGREIPSLEELLAQIATIETAVEQANAARDDANAAADAARQETRTVAGVRQDAQDALEDAQQAILLTKKWGNVLVTVDMLPTGSPPVVTLTDTGSGKTMAFSLPRGMTGLTPNLTIGTVTTGEEGSQAGASIRGTAENPILDLVIPRGDTGAIEGIPYSNDPPRALGAADCGQSSRVSRADHVHPMPTARDVGARPDDWLPTPEELGLVWRSGDVFRLGDGYTIFNGFVTSSNSVRITIPLNKPVTANAATIKNLNVTVRGIQGSFASNESISSSGITYRINPLGYITMIFKTQSNSPVNNVAVSVQINDGFEIEFATADTVASTRESILFAQEETGDESV